MFIGSLSVSPMKSYGEILFSNSKGPIRYVSPNNHECQTRPTLANIRLLLVLISVVKEVTPLIFHMFKFVFRIKKCKNYECKSI